MENKLAILLLLIFLMWVDNFPQAEKIPVCGFVRDGKTNERISGAVILSGGKGVSLSDSSGYFKFSLPPGKYSIECRYIGYELMIAVLVTLIRKLNKGRHKETFLMFV